MKTPELISRLKWLKKEYGDLPVMLNSVGIGDAPVTIVDAYNDN